MSWQNPFFTRTQFNTLEVEDMNRIDNNCEHLALIFGTSVTKQAWSTRTLLKESNFLTITENVMALQKAFFTHSASPPLPTAPYLLYSKLNNIEYCIYLLYNMYYNNYNEILVCDNETHLNDGGLF